MSAQPCWTTLFLLTSIIAVPVGAQDAGISASAIVEAVDVTGLRMSPDGHWVWFSTNQASIQDNSYHSRYFLVPWSGGVPVERPTSAIEWPRAGNGTPQRTPAASSGFPPGATGTTVSPDGRWTTYCVTPEDSVTAVPPDSMSRHAIEADSEYEPNRIELNGGLPSPAARLHPHPPPVCSVVDVAPAGRRATITLPASFTPLLPMTWLPNSTAFLIRGYEGAFLGDMPNLDVSFYGSLSRPRRSAEARLFVVDPATGRAQPAAAEPADWDAGVPVVSSDSRWCAFIEYDTSAKLIGHQTRLAIARIGDSASTRTWHPPAADTLAFFDRIVGWGHDNQTVLVVAQERGMSLFKTHTLTFSTKTGQFTELLADVMEDFGSVRSSTDGTRAVAIAQRPGESPEIVALDLRSSTATPRTLVTREWVNPTLARAPALGYDSLSWLSPDGRYRIAGHLILPPGFDRSGRHGRYPLLLFRAGGPGASRLGSWRGSLDAPLLAFASRGYVIMLSNPRTVDSRIYELNAEDYVASAFGDVMGGVDAVISRYPIDDRRLGILGFSYGGILSAYAIGHTNRFRAAVIGEGTMWAPMWTGVLHEQMAYSARDNLPAWPAAADPWSAAGRATSDSNFALNAADRVRTPNLVQTGLMAHGTLFPLGAVPWVDTMRRFGVPAEWWVYPRSGHGWEEPELVLDSYERHLAWFDYWLRGVPYPASVKRPSYDTWIKQREAADDPRWH